MTRLACLLALLAAPACADPSHAWGSGDDGPCRVWLTPMDEPDAVAALRFANRLIWDLHPETVTLEVGGLAVVVTVEGRGGRRPDLLTVVPPIGYRADPPTLLVADDSVGVVMIRPVPMS